jgi:hypothetical protein
MISNRQEQERVKILVIGQFSENDNDDTNLFFKKLLNENDYLHSRDMAGDLCMKMITIYSKEIDGTLFEIYDMRMFYAFISTKPIPKECYENAKGFIFINYDEVAKNSLQESCPNKVMTIDYDAKSMTPVSCLKSIGVINKNLVSTVNNKVKLLFEAMLFDQASSFSIILNFPKEITHMIVSVLTQLEFSNQPASFLFFQSPKNHTLPEFRMSEEGQKLRKT